MMTLYDRFCKAGVQIDSHESDLYVPDTPAVRAIIDEYKQENKLKQLSLSTFVSGIDGQRWIDIRFAYDPYWQRRA